MTFQKLILLFVIVLLGNAEVQAQQFISQKAQFNIKVKNESCKTETSSVALSANIDQKTGSVSFSIPVATFQLKSRVEELRFWGHCFPKDKYPMIYFAGKLENVEKWATNKSGIIPLKLKGHFEINGERIPLSENIVLQVDTKSDRKGDSKLDTKNVELAFNTTIVSEELDLDIDVVINLVEQSKGGPQ
ncbi:MAG: hypothetical protein AB8F74_00895 [Saprospiraceae bacterium]